METKVIQVDSVNIDLAKIADAAAVVDGGGVVGFPTDTVYGLACRVSGESLARLDVLKERDSNKPYTLHIGRPEDVGGYVPAVGLKAGKVIEKAWPGPLTIVFELDQEGLAVQRGVVGGDVFEGLYRGNSIGVRCPDNAVAAALLEETRYPVGAPSANAEGERPAVDAQEVLASLDGKIDLVLDGGPCKYGKSSTVAKIGKDGVEILRGGIYSRAELDAISEIRFLCVCTGNTCRSPMAEGIFRKYLGEKLGCEVDRLGDMGYKVSSAGLLDMGGAPASSESVNACAARGVDISSHRSQQLTAELIDESDLIFAMERMHQESVKAFCADAAEKCVLLAEDNITDPIGQRQAVYDGCADLIEDAVKKRIGELLL